MAIETYLTEQIIIQPGHINYDACKRYCAAARKVYNKACFEMRQAFFNKDYIGHRDTDKLLKTEFSDVYEALPSAISQRLIQVLGDNWKSWFASNADYAINPGKYKAKPRIPGYCYRAKTLTVGRNGYKIERGFLSLAGGKEFGFKKQKVTCCKYQPYNAPKDQTLISDVRIVPLGTSFVIELCAKVSMTPQIVLNPENYLSADLGIGNLVTFMTNQPELKPVLIKGNVIKSINAKYNKDKADLVSRHKAVPTEKNGYSERDNFKGKHVRSKSRKRFCLINDYFHKVSRYIVDYCLEHDIGNVVIGLNKDWKQEINIGKVNNQKFVSIPHKSLIDKIEYKAQLCGIKVTVREESYTSKASALDLDKIPTYDNKKKAEKLFSGKRVKRGLYLTKQKHLINADVNGAANILRKEIGDGWLQPHLESVRASWTAPVVIKHIDH